MKKLSLRVDDIHVAAFEVVARQGDRMGTVQGAEAISRYTYCDQETCFATCDQATCIC
jgi:hypothetical protein